MSKKLWLILILVLSHSAVAALTFAVTRSWLQQTRNTPAKQADYVAHTTTSIESKLERFIKDMSPYAKGSEAAIRNELLLTLRVFEQLEDPDRMLIIGLKPDDVANHQLVELQCVRSFLDSYSDAQNINVFAFTSEHYRPVLISLAGDSNPTPERAIKTKKQIQQLADAFLTLRKKALILPYTEIDDRLHFLEMLLDLTSENYSDAKVMAQPMLPFFNDREGRFLSLFEKWFNTPHAQKALPIEQFERLYQDGKVRVLGSAFNSYLTRIKARISQEQNIAKESQKNANQQLANAYSDIETFFLSIAQTISQ